MKAEQRKKWAQRAVAAALTLLALAALPSLWTLAFCPQGSCSLPDEALPLASAPLTESGLTELQRNGNFLLWFCSGLAILVSFAILIQAVLEICRGGLKRRGLPPMPARGVTHSFSSFPPSKGERARTVVRARSLSVCKSHLALPRRFFALADGSQRFDVDPLRTKGSDHVRVNGHALKVNVVIISEPDRYVSGFR